MIQKMCYEGLAGEVIQKMHYEGKSQSWNWDKHCAKFHQEIRAIDEWAMAGMDMHMSNKDENSPLLKIISHGLQEQQAD